MASPYEFQPQSKLLSLPAELRLQIYSYLVLPAQSSSSPYRAGLVVTDHHDYYTASGLDDPSESESDFSTASRRNGTSLPALEIRVLDPQPPTISHPSLRPNANPQLRTTLSIRTSRFRARTMQTTYALARNPGIYAAILATCRQCHAEAAPLLYGAHTFNFSTHVEAIEPFLGDLTPYSRACIRTIGLVKRGLPYEREFDRAEWAGACRYLASPEATLYSLRTLKLGVVAGCPGPQGWDNVRTFSKEDFVFHLGPNGKEGTRTPPELQWRDFRGIRYSIGVTTVEEDEWRGMEWVGELLAIKGLKNVEIRAIVEHCPPPMSERMEFWVAFSKSVEAGFAEYIQDGLVGA
ncbi:hypothetical protein NA57DRAFT_77227 [Rhizodiscina lignyota]|uniref:Uncharacterized protein n=1 Tax=Rhizodiscina lignyota TaxID=1504668 RepID=A0A9P4IEC3_9PEZI|nr:hypothetical protein NA57DRAFT_77227 [Rhizodiscina lignyota]